MQLCYWVHSLYDKRALLNVLHIIFELEDWSLEPPACLICSVMRSRRQRKWFGKRGPDNVQSPYSICCSLPCNDCIVMAPYSEAIVFSRHVWWPPWVKFLLSSFLLPSFMSGSLYFTHLFMLTRPLKLLHYMPDLFYCGVSAAPLHFVRFNNAFQFLLYSVALVFHSYHILHMHTNIKLYFQRGWKCNIFSWCL